MLILTKKQIKKIPFFLDLISISAHMLLSVPSFRRLSFRLDQPRDSVFAEDRKIMPAQPRIS